MNSTAQIQRASKILLSTIVAVWLSLWQTADGRHLWGFIDKAGRFVVPAKYQSVYSFDKGYAEVWPVESTNKQLDQRDHLRIDKQGNTIASVSGDSGRESEQDTTTHSYKVIRDGASYYLLSPEKQRLFEVPGKYLPSHFVDGLMLLEPDHSQASPGNQLPPIYIDEKGRVAIKGSEGCKYFHFSDGVAVFSRDDHDGLIDKQGHVLLAPKYDDISWFEEGLASARIGKKWCYLNKSGDVAIRLPCNCTYAADFSEGLAAIAIGGQPIYKLTDQAPQGSKWGFIDKAGKVVISPKFTNPFSELFLPQFNNGLSLAAVGNPLAPRYGFIDKQGEFVVAPVFVGAEQFSEDLAAVAVGPYGFDPDEFKAVVPGFRAWTREKLFAQFLEQYGLIGMSREQVCKFLGQDEPCNGDTDYVALRGSFCGNTSGGVEIKYKNNKAVAYRFTTHDDTEPWQTRKVRLVKF